jgi:uncharacterized protein (TIGR03435 family)
MSLDLVSRRGLLLTAVCLAVALPGHAQLAAATATVPAYDAVSIKPHKADGSGKMMMMINQGQDSYSGTNITLKMMLRNAYNLTTEDQIVGLSGAVDSARFDVEAKLDAETIEAQKKLSKDARLEQQRLMMQAMLAERFKLKVHHETKELTVYDLVIAKGGFKLKEADPNSASPNAAPNAGSPNAMATSPNGMRPPDGAPRKGMMRMGMGDLNAQGIPIPSLANFLAQMLHKQVRDKTGLTGSYDIQLKWQPDDMPAESKEASGADSAPSIFTAVQEQLGLRLEAVKGPVDTIVVDHVELPTEN